MSVCYSSKDGYLAHAGPIEIDMGGDEAGLAQIVSYAVDRPFPNPQLTPRSDPSRNLSIAPHAVGKWQGADLSLPMGRG